MDLVVAAYLLNYARTPGQLLRFCRVCYKALKPGGRFVGLNNNVRNVTVASGSLRKYGLERTWDRPLAEGNVIRYTMFSAGGERFGFGNFYLRRHSHRGLRECGVRRLPVGRHGVAPGRGRQPGLGRVHGEPADRRVRGRALMDAAMVGANRVPGADPNRRLGHF